MAIQVCDHTSCFDVPQLHMTSRIPRRQQRVIGRKRHGCHFGLMSVECLHPSAGHGIPENRSFVIAAGRDPFSVARHRGSCTATTMVQTLNLSSGRNIPDAGCVIHRCGEQPLATRKEDCGRRQISVSFSERHSGLTRTRTPDTSCAITARSDNLMLIL